MARCTDGSAYCTEEMNAPHVFALRGPFAEKGREDMLQKPFFSLAHLTCKVGGPALPKPARVQRPPSATLLVG